MREVKKLDMAVEQLEDALKAYFAQRYYSAIVLAGASEQLLAGYVQKHKMEPSWSNMRKNVTLIANGLRKDAGESETTNEKDIGSLLNRAYNHSKHASAKDHVVRMNPKFEARELIHRCVSNYDMLFRLTHYGLRDISLIQDFLFESINGDALGKESTEILETVKTNGSGGR